MPVNDMDADTKGEPTLNSGNKSKTNINKQQCKYVSVTNIIIANNEYIRNKLLFIVK